MFNLLSRDLNDGTEPSELWTRFSFIHDLHTALRSELPMLPVCIAYASRFPKWEDDFEFDYLIELTEGFKSNEDVEADQDQSDREETDTRNALAQSAAGRETMEREDAQFTRMIETARLRFEIEEALKAGAERPMVLQSA